MAGPLPVQVCTWLERESDFDPDPRDRGASGGQWLYCSKSTAPGDRQAIWSGVGGNGIVAVVDFSGEVRPRSDGAKGYEGWGRVTNLRRQVSVDRAQSDPVLARRFSKPIQSVYALTPEEGQAI